MNIGEQGTSYFGVFRTTDVGLDIHPLLERRQFAFRHAVRHPGAEPVEEN
jgi:hypothetical protein